MQSTSRNESLFCTKFCWHEKIFVRIHVYLGISMKQGTLRKKRSLRNRPDPLIYFFFLSRLVCRECSTVVTCDTGVCVEKDTFCIRREYCIRTFMIQFKKNATRRQYLKLSKYLLHIRVSDCRPHWRIETVVFFFLFMNKCLAL